MPTKEEVRNRVSEIAKDCLDIPGVPQGDKSLKDDYKADSLDGIELMMQVEDAFGVEIPDAEAEHLRTINQITDLVIIKLNQKSNIN